jgi:Transcription factor/nuclear export subunit protein 2
LASGEAQQMRNSFLIMKQFSTFFPRMKAHGEALVAELQKIVSTEKRDNLKTLAISHLGQLEKNRPAWISNDNFMSISKVGAFGRLSKLHMSVL